MDGRGCYQDNIFVESLWRSVKYESVYLKVFENVAHLREDLKRYFAWYNKDRPHQWLDDETPDEVFCDRPLTQAA